ncbi:MAG: hypothetical protein ACYS22_05460, partial [Planctomycetota bacterium]
SLNPADVVSALRGHGLDWTVEPGDPAWGSLAEHMGRAETEAEQVLAEQSFEAILNQEKPA